MAKLFYDHLIVIEEVTAVLDAHRLTEKEHAEFLNLIDQTLHDEILDTIFTHLPKDKHDAFLTRFHQAPHDINLMAFLKEATAVNIENEILKTANRIKQKALSAIKKSRKEGR